MEKINGLIKMYFLKLYYIKRLILKGMKYYLGKNCKIIIKKDSKIELGDKVWISDMSSMVSAGDKICIGDNCYFNSNLKLVSLNKIVIGTDCLFGPNVVIVDHNHSFKDRNRKICEQGYEIGSVTIGNNVWVGANCVISKDVTIADNVVIGAGSVVTKNILYPGVYCGVPAVKMKDI